MRLKRRLTRRFFSRKERTKPTPGVNFERDNDVGLPEVSPISPFLQLVPQHDVLLVFREYGAQLCQSQQGHEQKTRRTNFSRADTFPQQSLPGADPEALL